MQRPNKRAARLAATAAVIIAASSPVAAAGYQASTPAPPNAPLTGETGIAIRYDSGAGATPSARAFLALQLNLCDSGFATRPGNDCYRGGKSISEAFHVILDMAPSLVTLNEVCRDDVRTALFPAMERLWPNEWVFWGFMAAGNRRTGKAYLCKNGDAYGIGMLGRLFTTSTPTVTASGQNYPPDSQDPNDNELRSWLCVNANHSYWGCTTHLHQSGGRLALDQCGFLTKQVAQYHPAVLAGDLNLRYQPGDPFNVQRCVPSGWFREGDGDVQHTMATNDFALNGTRKVPMEFTDHPAWAVSLTKP